ncbi:phenazine biosynthesis FMN-dependent oxidase PhzG [Streptomyces sp. SBT349]|uniref:phenazine biosynthesis FMN-dependent oxidase PhzG n=1 Tax=Streptomyces sp. SBT349 TaxID=1580539 RepID=UPI00066DC0D1|nr:phenazine biosynthesis FMN-dependent oxidase PhzG [Streptomyces sp. SBT349]
MPADIDLTLPEFDNPPAEPIGLLRAWFDTAVKHGVREPGVVSLATADATGRTSNRIIQTIRITGRGLVFSSHTGSRKGRDIAATGWGSGVLYWRETAQQIVLSGPVAPLPEEESGALWAARPPSTHAMSVASRQSEPLEDEEALRAEAVRLAGSGEALPRPAAWVGYELVPETVEFWHASPDRLHRRLVYGAAGGGWTCRRLQP